MAPVVIAFIRGSHLVRGVKAFLSLTMGEGVILEREPTNPVDPNAVKVFNATNEPVGYADYLSARILASHIDAGVIYSAYVISAPKIKFGKYVQDSCRMKCIPIFKVKENENRDVPVPVL